MSHSFLFQQVVEGDRAGIGAPSILVEFPLDISGDG